MSEKRSDVSLDVGTDGRAVGGEVPNGHAADGAVGERAADDVASVSVVRAVESAVSQVCDPEYPDLTIADLGILEKVWLRQPGETGEVDPAAQAGDNGTSRVVVDLVPTILGCPALGVIERDVRSAAQAALNPSDLASPAAASENPAAADASPAIEVRFLTEPIWTPKRISKAARRLLGSEYTIAVRTKSQTPPCPHCGAAKLEFRSDFGPTPCRKVYWCPSCRNPIEMVEQRSNG